MIDWMIGLVLGLVIAVMTLAMPRVARCPTGWSLNEGVRPTGEYACYAPLPRCCGDAKGPCEAIACPKVEVTRGQIYCTGGARAIVVDYRTVGCQR